MTSILNVIRSLLRSEPARFISYGTIGALAFANVVAHALGYTALPDGIATSLALLVTALLTEAIRRFVYAPDTVNELVGPDHSVPPNP
jgi:hypothetical protein